MRTAGAKLSRPWESGLARRSSSDWQTLQTGSHAYSGRPDWPAPSTLHSKRFRPRRSVKMEESGCLDQLLNIQYRGRFATTCTGVSIYDFNPAEREATLRITSYDTGLPRGVLGRSISGRRCSAGNHLLYEDAWFQSGHAKSARFRPGFNRRPQINLERSWSFRVPTNARWPSARAWRMEPRDTSDARVTCAHY